MNFFFATYLIISQMILQFRKKIEEIDELATIYRCKENAGKKK